MSAEPLRGAAQQRHHATVERAQHALRDLDHEGAPISFQAVARRAGVSRQWLYTQPTLRAELERLRERRGQSTPVPSVQRASEDSLRQRVQTLRREPAPRRTARCAPSSRSHTASAATRTAATRSERTGYDARDSCARTRARAPTKCLLTFVKDRPPASTPISR